MTVNEVDKYLDCLVLEVCIRLIFAVSLPILHEECIVL